MTLKPVLIGIDLVPPMVPNWLVTSVPDDVVAWKEPST